jgi:Na+-driven multidrug efflux pump
VSFIAGYTATNKLYGLLEVASLSYGYAMSTYVGQNLGARKIQRIRHGVRTGAILGVLTSLAIALCMILFGRNIVSLFIDLKAPGAEEAVRIACEYLTIMASFLPILYLLFNYRSSLQGMGHTFIPMLSGVAEFIMRVGTVLWLTRWLDYRALFWAEVFCWAGAVAILYPGYLNVMRRMWYNPGEAPEESARNET